jgi:hypothetical protein
MDYVIKNKRKYNDILNFSKHSKDFNTQKIYKKFIIRPNYNNITKLVNNIEENKFDNFASDLLNETEDKIISLGTKTIDEIKINILVSAIKKLFNPPGGLITFNELSDNGKKRIIFNMIRLVERQELMRHSFINKLFLRLENTSSLSLYQNDIKRMRIYFDARID